MVLQLSESFETENAIPYNQQIDNLAVRHSLYLNVLQLENRISEYQPNDYLPGQHYPYLNVSKLENAILENQQIDHITVGTTHM